jgi:hypothetical protein
MVPAVNDGCCVEWAAAKAPARGFRDSGDEFCVRPFENRTMIAVLDGLGHGPDAASVSRQGVRLLEQAQTHDVLKLVRTCHDGLRGSRGLVMSLAMFDEAADTMTWLGVGNVCGTLWCPRWSRQQTLLLRGGLIGDALPNLQVSVVPVSEGDTLIFTTDGLDDEIDTRGLQGQSVQAIAEKLLTRRCKSRNDDALALVARYRRVPR